MNEFLVFGSIAVAHLIGVGFFFGVLHQKIKNLEDEIETMFNHLSSIQKSLIDIETKLMNLNARLTILERKIENGN